MLTIAPGVSLRNQVSQMATAQQSVNAVYQNFGIKECVITSGFEGEHSQGSLHSRDGLCRANDYRTRTIPTERIAPLVIAVVNALGGEFQVFYEAPEKPANLPDAYYWKSSQPHLHVEYDPK